MHVQTKIIDPRLKLAEFAPQYMSAGAAAIDLRAAIPEEDGAICINPDETVFVPVGFAIHLGTPNLAAMILPRSGLGSKQGIVLGNGTGLIDSDYQGEIMVALWNRSNKKFYVNPMERIAQMVVVPVEQIILTEVEEFIPSERGAGGFGSTGRS